MGAALVKEPPELGEWCCFLGDGQKVAHHHEGEIVDDEHLITITDHPDVILHVYDVGNSTGVQRANKVFRRLGTGAFHAAVEVYGAEYSFGYCDHGTGVFACPPKGCHAHHYRETIPMGKTPKSHDEVVEIIRELSELWKGPDYDLLRHNCTHFSRDMLIRLDVAPMPHWVLNLAGAGATISDGYQKARDKAHAMAIIAAAKAGNIDKKYHVKEKFAKIETKVVNSCERSCTTCLEKRR